MMRVKSSKMQSSSKCSTPPVRHTGAHIEPPPKPEGMYLAAFPPSHPTPATRATRGRQPTVENAAGLSSARSLSRSRSRSPVMDAATAAGIPSETTAEQRRDTTVFEVVPRDPWVHGIANCWCETEFGPPWRTLPYRLPITGDTLGKGSAAEVLLGIAIESGMLIAVKQLYKTNAREASELSVEVNALRVLRHRHIVRYLGTDTCPAYSRILLEYVSGGSVASLIAKFGAFAECTMIVYIRQALEGLVYLHQHDVVHCDIKGLNMLVTAEGIVKLADFGICKMASDSSMGWAGSLWWMSPEAVRGEGPCKPRDIWALGCVIIEMLTEDRPWASTPINCDEYLFLGNTTTSPPLEPGYALATETTSFFDACTRVDPNSRATAGELLSHAIFSSLRSNPDVPGGHLCPVPPQLPRQAHGPAPRPWHR
eukprot:RCo045825